MYIEEQDRKVPKYSRMVGCYKDYKIKYLTMEISKHLKKSK